MFGFHRLGLFILLTCVVGFLPASADVHTGRDILGLATEASDSGFFQVVDHPSGTLDLHLMVYGYEHEQGIVGWDCALILPDDMIITGTDLMGDGINQRPQPGNFRVHTREPLMPDGGMIHLATIQVMAMNDGPMDIFLSSDPEWGNSGLMGFARQTFETIRMSFNWPEGCSECPVFQMTQSQPTEKLAWDGMKALFR